MSQRPAIRSISQPGRSLVRGRSMRRAPALAIRRCWFSFFELQPRCMGWRFHAAVGWPPSSSLMMWSSDGPREWRGRSPNTISSLHQAQTAPGTQYLLTKRCHGLPDLPRFGSHSSSAGIIVAAGLTHKIRGLSDWTGAGRAGPGHCREPRHAEWAGLPSAAVEPAPRPPASGPLELGTRRVSGFVFDHAAVPG